MEEFVFRTKIAAGPGAVAALKSLRAHRLFLVTEAPFSENGRAQKVIEAAGSREVEIYDAVTPEPTVTLAAEVTARCAAFGPDLLAALGSAGAIDCAKAALYFGGLGIPFVTIPTSYGSGTQVTDLLELTHEHHSYTLESPRLQPTLTVLEEDFLEESSPALAGEAGFTLLAHAQESYTARNAGTLPSIFAREAFRTAYACLPAAFAGDASVGPRLLMASTLAGMAYGSTGLGLCHALSKALGARFSLSQGRLSAVLLPAVIGSNGQAAGSRYARLARFGGLGGSTDILALGNLKKGLVRLRRDLGLPQTLSQAGISPGSLWSQTGEIVAAVLKDPCCRTNPLEVEDFQIRRILEEVAGPG